ncbi:MAG: secretin N-terminal domain-containing protein [Rhodospirillaceae bacterium]|nr:secretin N-terminal domain-containing protein [Rhodospirillaceae bacterium]
MDPRISGGIIMTSTDRPFIEVIERICELAELRYSFNRNVLKVEVDDPYLEQYRMDVLNQKRSSSGQIGSSTDARSAAQSIGSGSSGGGGSNSSASSIESSSESDFWTGIGQNVGQILTSIQSRRGNAAIGIKAEIVPETLDGDAQAQSSAAPAGGGTTNPLQQAQQIAAGQQPAAEPEPDMQLKTAGDQQFGGQALQNANYSINPQAGLITVFANQRQQKAIERYLRTVRNSVAQQVLIEAKILEITLNDQYRAGINWQAFLGPGIFDAAGNRIGENLSLSTNFARDVVPADFTNPTVTAAFRNSDNDLNLAAQLVKAFGTVRTLSSPRITVINNQAAVLKVAQNQIFFDLEVQREQGELNQPDLITVDSEIKSVPVGLIMNVQPSVDPVNRRISLSLRPSVTRITGFVSDPGVAITVAQINATNNTGINVSSQIPIIEVREIDSLVNMGSGETVVMGGLMQETSENAREGLPGLMDLPVVGQAVSQNIRSSQVTELVIFLRATIVDGRGTVADEDIRLYKTFTPDPRPLAF